MERAEELSRQARAGESTIRRGRAQRLGWRAMSRWLVALDLRLRDAIRDVAVAMCPFETLIIVYIDVICVYLYNAACRHIR